MPIVRKIHHISEKQFRMVNCLPTSTRFDQCINTIAYNFINSTCPYYLNKIFKFAPQCRIDLRNKFAKLKNPSRKTNIEQKIIFHASSSI